jgi:hypothetical protein
MYRIKTNISNLKEIYSQYADENKACSQRERRDL